MTSEVLYGREIFTPYFNMNRFEDNIYNRPKQRAIRIKKRKRIRLIDRLLVSLTAILFIILLVYIAAITYYGVKVYNKNNEVVKYERILEAKRKENAGKIDVIKGEIKLDDLKMKAYMEYNMITPTEKNIIYFDKNDSGFVRQYENIR